MAHSGGRPCSGCQNGNVSLCFLHLTMGPSGWRPLARNLQTGIDRTLDIVPSSQVSWHAGTMSYGQRWALKFLTKGFRKGSLCIQVPRPLSAAGASCPLSSAWLCRRGPGLCARQPLPCLPCIAGLCGPATAVGQTDRWSPSSLVVGVTLLLSRDSCPSCTWGLRSMEETLISRQRCVFSFH